VGFAAIEGVRQGFEAPVFHDLVPVHPALTSLIPSGGLEPGGVVTVAGSMALSLALLAGPLAKTDWIAVVGLPGAGFGALARMMGITGPGPAPRVLVVDEPGPRWPDVTAALLEACRIVLVRPSGRSTAAVRRRLTVLGRRHGAALVVDGEWEGAGLRLRVEQSVWTGLADGTGHLQGRRALIAAAGRGAAGAGGRTWLWLPSADGTITAAETPAVHRHSSPPAAVAG
jgi:hypothetical protein